MRFVVSRFSCVALERQLLYATIVMLMLHLQMVFGSAPEPFCHFDHFDQLRTLYLDFDRWRGRDRNGDRKNRRYRNGTRFKSKRQGVAFLANMTAFAKEIGDR
jgi:hypothetical protein